MQFKNTLAVLENITQLNMPISNTTRGEQIQQTYRNNLTTQLKEALYQDCLEAFAHNEAGIIPYITREGVILELPNASVADGTDPNMCNGAISLEWAFTFKGLEFDAQTAADEYEFNLQQKAKKAAEAEKKKAEKIKRDKAARDARELKRMRLIEAMAREEED